MMRQTLAVSGLRDLNKAKRRDAILDAALTLLGSRDSNDITTEEIAALAGVSPATVYNLSAPAARSSTNSWLASWNSLASR